MSCPLVQYQAFIACYHVVAMCYISHIGSYRPVYNFPVSQTLVIPMAMDVNRKIYDFT